MTNRFKRTTVKSLVTLVLCFALAMAMCVSASAATAWEWTYPTAPVSTVNADGTRNVTVTCTNAGFNIGDILGADQPAGGMYGRYDGPIKLWATDINVNPDKYVTNLAYLWCKYNDEPGATTSKFPAEQTELSPHQYTLNVVSTQTGQYGRTLAGSGPNTVNGTIVAEYGNIPPVLFTRADIICGSTIANYEEFLELMHSDEWKNSEYYMEGDENYNPIFVEIGTGTITQRVNSMKDLAKAMNQVIAASNGKIVARYGDPEVIANDIEKTIFGTYFYIQKLIDEGTLDKKKATWIANKNTSNDTYNCTYYGMEICHEFFGDIFDGPAENFVGNSDYDNKVYTIKDLAEMDFIICGGGDGTKLTLLNDFAAAGYSADQIPLIMADMNRQGFDAGWGMGGASTTWALAYPYSWIYAYGDELAEINPAVNPTAMYQFILEKFMHIDPAVSDRVTVASLANMWNLQADNDRVPDKTNYLYDEKAMEYVIFEGINYATSHNLKVNGAYECYWDPFYQVSSYNEYVENYTNVDGKGAFVSAGVLAKGTDLNGYYVRTGGDSISTYTYAPASGEADGQTKYYSNYVTAAMFNSYVAGAKAHVWKPETKKGIAADMIAAAIPANASGKSANFKNTQSYTANTFSDIDENSWYGTNEQGTLKKAYELGIINGMGDGTFKPAGNVTLAETIKMAAVVLNTYYGGAVKFDQSKGDNWYDTYVDFAIANGMIKAGEFSDYNRAATRSEVAYIFASALPASELSAKNTVAFKNIPDVSESTAYADDILLLYKAGVLTGDAGNNAFRPSDAINRAEAATIITRVALPAERQSLSF